MPWSQMPPMPHAHGRQLGPYLLIGHCPHEVPFGNVPVGQLEVHVWLGGSSSSGVAEPAVQVVHPVAAAHVPHVAWQALQTVPFE